MKVKCPLQGNCGSSCQYPEAILIKGDCFLDFNIPTADLIAELEKRRLCEKCEGRLMRDYPGCHCIYETLKDNFKADKGGK